MGIKVDNPQQPWTLMVQFRIEIFRLQAITLGLMIDTDGDVMKDTYHFQIFYSASTGTDGQLLGVKNNGWGHLIQLNNHCDGWIYPI